MSDTILKDSTDFGWHKLRLDAEGRQHYRHFGEPTHYPCKVYSVYDTNDNGPDEYHHEFTYRVVTKCAACGHEHIGWPGESSVVNAADKATPTP